jgi:hypothetical protein
VEDIDKIERKTAAGIHAGQTVRHIKKGGTNETDCTLLCKMFHLPESLEMAGRKGCRI